MEPATTVQRAAAQKTTQQRQLAPRLEQAVDAAKRVSERQISAVPEKALTATFHKIQGSTAEAAQNTQLRLAVDDTTGRVIGKIVDRESGELVQQIPSEEMLSLIAKTKELFGQLVNEKV